MYIMSKELSRKSTIYNFCDKKLSNTSTIYIHLKNYQVNQQYTLT